MKEKEDSITEVSFKIVIKGKGNIQITLCDPPEASCKVDELYYAQRESGRASWQNSYGT